MTGSDTEEESDKTVDITLYAAPTEGLTTYLWRPKNRAIFGVADK